MAEQRVVLDFFVNGTSRIDKLVNKVSQLEGVVNSLNQVPLEINVAKATSQFDKLDSELKLLESTLKGQKASFIAANKSINDQQKAIDKSGASIEKYQDQLVSIQRQLQSLNPGTKKYNELLDRQSKIIKDYASAQSDLAEAQDKIFESQKNKNIIGQRLEKTQAKVGVGQKVQSDAKRLKDLTEALDGLASQYLELGIAQKKAKETTPLASGLDIRAARPRTQENLSIAQLNSQASALDLIAKNSSVASSQFNRFAIATEVASQRIYEAGQQRLKALAFGLSKEAQSVNIGTGGTGSIAAVRNTIDSLIGSYGGVVKSEAALSSYVERLRSLQSLVPYLSEEYGRLERAIGDVSAEMESLQKMTQLRGAVSKIQPQAGPASLLPSESVKSAAEQSKYYTKLEEKKETLLDRQSKILEKVNDSLLAEGRKKAFNLEIDKATELAISNQVEEAEKLTKEINKQVDARLKLFNGSKTQTFGALGTGFLPVSGKLKSGELVPGSPAFKQRTNELTAAWIKRGGPALPPAPRPEPNIPGAVKLGGFAETKERSVYTKKIADLTLAIDEAEKRILRTTANELAQKELLNEVQAARNALLDNDLEKSKRIVQQIDRNRFSLERQQKDQKASAKGLQDEAERRKRIGDQFRILETIQKTYIDLEGKGVKFSREKLQLSNLLAKADQAPAEASARYVRALDQQISKFRTFQQLRKSEAVVAGTFASPVRPQTAERVETVRKNLLNQALGIERQIIGVESKGGSIADEKVKIEQTILQLKNLQNQSTQQQNELIAQQLIDSRAITKEEANRLAKLGIGKNKDKAKEPGAGLQAALDKLAEARAARVSFLGEGVSPAEAIDKIVREFNTGKSEINDTADNIVKTFISKFTGGASRSAAAAKGFAEASTDSIEKAYGIASPSRFMIEIVKNLVDTYVREIQKSYPRIKSATAKAFGEETLLRDVTKLRATNKGFEEYGRPSTGFRPLPLGAGTGGATSEFNNLMSSFRKQIAELTTQPEIYRNMLNALPNARLSTDLIGAANRRAAASEIPSFMPTQRMLGPGELEKFISAELAKYLRDIKVPNPWVGLIGDYEQFIAKVISETDKLRVSPSSGIRSLPQGRVAGLLSAAGDSTDNKFEDRIRQAFERSAQRSAAVFAEDATRRFEAGIAAIGGSAIPPGTPPGGRSGTGGVPAGGGGAVNQTARLLGLDAIADISRVSTRELEALSAAASELRSVLDPTIEGFDRLDNQLRETIGSIGRQLERRDPNADFLTRRVGPRGGRAISEGLIGGAFPLLFGQGAGASLGGLVGGAAGGFAGGGLGFGLSLIGTALGTAFDQLGAAATEAGKALRDPISGFEKLKEANLLASKSQEYYIQKLIETGRISQATAVIQSEIIKKIGVSGVNDLNNLAKSSDELSKAWAEFTLQLQAALAGPLAGLLQWVTGVVGAFNQAGRFKNDVENIRSGLTPEQRARFDKERVDASVKPYQKLEQQMAAEQKVIEKYRAMAVNKTPSPTIDPAKAEEGRKAAQQAADEIKQAYRQGFQLQQQAIDLQRQAADLQRRVSDDIFNKQQEIQRTAIENESKRKQIIIETIDLEYKKRISNEEGRAAEVLAAEAELVKVKKQGEADIQAKKQTLELDIAKQKRETENYVYRLNIDIDGIRRATLNYEMSVADYRLEVERKIAEQRRIDQMGQQTAPNGQPYYGPGGAPASKSSGRNYANIGGFMNGREMLHGIPGYAGNDAGHSGGNAHYHFAGKNPGETKAVADYLKANNIKITEFGQYGQRVGGHAVGSQHYRERGFNAFDVPGAQVPVGQEIALMKRVHKLVNDYLAGQGSSVPQYTQAASQVKRPQIPMVNAGATGGVMANLDEQDAAIKAKSVNLEERLNQLNERKALQALADAATGERDLKRRQDAINLLKNEIQYIAAASQEEQERTALGAAALTKLEDRLAVDAEILKNTKLTGEARRVLEAALAKGLEITKQQNELDKQALDLTQKKRFETEKAALIMQGQSKNIGIRAGYIGEAAAVFEAEMRASGNLQQARELADLAQKNQVAKGNQLLESYNEAATALQKLATWENVAVTGAKSIGDAFGQTFREIAVGSATAQEILAGFFQNLANSFADMASQMITNLVQIFLYKQLAGLFDVPMGGAGAAAGGAAAGGLGGGGAGAFNFFDGGLLMAANGYMFPNGIQPFAMGGIVNSPTLFKFASGGAFSTGVMGEAGPEAIMPLKRGSDGKLGVEVSGTDAGSNVVNVVVNVDAKGTSVQGNDQSGNQLGRAISTAVQQELIRQKRPGGLLA